MHYWCSHLLLLWLFIISIYLFSIFLIPEGVLLCSSSLQSYINYIYYQLKTFFIDSKGNTHTHTHIYAGRKFLIISSTDIWFLQVDNVQCFKCKCAIVFLLLNCFIYWLHSLDINDVYSLLLENFQCLTLCYECIL